MSSNSEKSSTSSFLLSAQALVILGIIWAVMALLFFLLFSVPLTPDAELPTWYSLGTYVFELGAYLGASLVCFRNWKSPQMVSGRNVWLGIGLGMLFYFIAGVLFGVWELYFLLDPYVSPADAFYIGSYIVLIWGMIIAVTSKRLNLAAWQWGLLAGIATIGIAIAVWIAAPEAVKTLFGFSSPPAQQVVTGAPAAADGQKAPAVKKSKGKSTPPTTTKTQAEVEDPALEQIESSPAPEWVKALDEQLSPYAYFINLFYIVGDVFLLIIATALLLAFWGGRFSQSWRMIAAATFSLYIADMSFKWLDAQEVTYRSGSLLEIFFVFSAILFGIGAVLEFDISSRSRLDRRIKRSAHKT